MTPEEQAKVNLDIFRLKKESIKDILENWEYVKSEFKEIYEELGK